MCKSDVKLINLTFIHCTYIFEKHKQISLVKTINKLSLIKSVNNLKHMKNINNLSVVKTIIEISITKLKKLADSIHPRSL
jgi:hypothetical protein